MCLSLWAPGQLAGCTCPVHSFLNIAIYGSCRYIFRSSSACLGAPPSHFFFLFHLSLQPLRISHLLHHFLSACAVASFLFHIWTAHQFLWIDGASRAGSFTCDESRIALVSSSDLASCWTLTEISAKIIHLILGRKREGEKMLFQYRRHCSSSKSGAARMARSRPQQLSCSGDLPSPSDLPGVTALRPSLGYELLDRKTSPVQPLIRRLNSIDSTVGGLSSDQVKWNCQFHAELVRMSRKVLEVDPRR